MATGQTFSGQMSAWFKKRKMGKNIVRISQYNTRYFTIDFDNCIFFYAQAVDSKKVSAVVSFTDMVDISLVEAPVEKTDDNISEHSSASKVSVFKRLGRGSSKETARRHVLTLMTKSSTAVEMLSDSLDEATQWFAALQFAISLSSRRSNTSAAPPTPADASQQLMRGARGIDGGFEAPNADPVAAAAQSDHWVAGQTITEDCGASSDSLTTSVTQKNFLDFSTQLDSAPVADAQVTAEGESVVHLPAADSLQVTEFGFAAIDDHDSDSDSDKEEGSGYSPRRDSASSGRSTGAESTDGDTGGTKTKAQSYKDQHEGLSIKERLANLEFSDDEEDDDPFNLGTA